NRIAPLPYWDIKFAGAHGPQQIKICRHYADDRVAFTVKREALADDIACRTEFALPESGCDHRYGSRCNEVFACYKVSPDHRNNAQLTEKIRTHKLRVDLFGVTEAGKDKGRAPLHRHGGKRPVIFLPIQKIGKRNGAGRKVGLALV